MRLLRLFRSDDFLRKLIYEKDVEKSISKNLLYDIPLGFYNLPNIKREHTMPESLLQKLEEKMMLMISEVEELRKENLQLNQENSTLKMEKESHARKLQDLIGLLDAVSSSESALINANANLSAVKPLLVQGDKIFG